MRGQLAARNQVLSAELRAAELRKSSEALIAKLDGLEKRLHNPEAEVIYDILAARDGGARLYSRLSPLLDWAGGGDGGPTQGAREVYAAHKAKLDGYEAELRQLIDGDLAAANETARGLGLPVVYVPAATAEPVPAAVGSGG